MRVAPGIMRPTSLIVSESPPALLGAKTSIPLCKRGRRIERLNEKSEHGPGLRADDADKPDDCSAGGSRIKVCESANRRGGTSWNVELHYLKHLHHLVPGLFPLAGFALTLIGRFWGDH
jgi:hypothetical protein